MGSCVSRTSASTPVELAHAATAMVMDMDGSVLRFAAQVMAHEALGAAFREASRFLCCSDEMEFDAPATALDADDELRAGQLYFALPLSMLRRPLSGQEMAELAVKACAALGAAHVVADAGRVAAATAGVSSGDKSDIVSGGACAAGRKRHTGRVTPLLDIDRDGDEDEEFSCMTTAGMARARRGTAVVGRLGRRGMELGAEAALVQRLSVLDRGIDQCLVANNSDHGKV
ncbi:hypothetical protein ACP70R_007086 [Stipagrostis hirtigluma subsp. patula]